MTRIIVHVAEIDISKDTGMGRVSYAWKHEFERRGYEFIHIGPNQVGNVHHRACFPYAAFKIYQQLKLKPSLILVHEPASGVFIRAKVPIALFSHGAERRAWNLSLQENNESIQKPSLKTRLLFPYWRLRLCDWGLRYSDLLLLINQDDCDFIQNYYCRKAEHIFQFQNGVNSSTIDETIVADEPITILFLGSWINLSRSCSTLTLPQSIAEMVTSRHWPRAKRCFTKLAGISSSSCRNFPQFSC